MFAHAEAAALVARFTTPPTYARKALIDTLIGSLKTGGVWSKLDALHVMAAADSQAARQNWIADQYNLTAVSGPTFTADRGYQGDGAASYASTGAAANALSKLAQNSCTAMFWSRTNASGASTYDFGVSNSNNITIQGRQTTGISIRANSGTGIGVATADSLGLYGFSRSASSTVTVYKNGAVILSDSSVSGALPTGTIEYFHSTGGFGSRQGAAGCFGSALTDAEHLALYNALNTYLIAIGAA